MTRENVVRNGRGPEEPKTTQASAALSLLRDDILQGRLLPGARLRFDDLRDQYQIGLSPLREALMRLSSEGLVILEDQRGFRVAPVSKPDLIDITRTRQQLECLALRASIARGDDEWEGNLLSTFHQLEKSPRTTQDDGANPGWESRHAAFHYALVSACDSRLLLQFRELLYDQSTRYRRLSQHYLDQPRDDVAEHRGLMEAALARDADTAALLITAHFQKTADIVLAGATFE